MDLISRRAALDAIGDEPLVWMDGEYELGLQNQWQSDVDALKDLPSAQPEIIRCKDCKHYTEPNIEYCELYGAMILWGKDDFCSRGERRSDE